ncbi:hypothetical protein MN116_000599 [Schistosoma mekongi]|uniref:Reverse transcriptase domain-containing protein n=1 Tax=Schistosoma mekongi TaxID=38744 RepID=A0AAE1ZB75_SCHME|nr:hypothetical protein MN116_000599 [Schistosoma mekongi]
MRKRGLKLGNLYYALQNSPRSPGDHRQNCMHSDIQRYNYEWNWFVDLKLGDVPLSTVYHRIVNMKNGKEFMEILKELDNVFEKCLGCCTTMKVSLRLVQNASPVFCSKGPVTHASLPEVDAELQLLDKQGVLTPVSFSAWVASLVFIKKTNGTLRISDDLTTELNAAVEQHHYPLKVLDDLFSILTGGGCFAKLDPADAYLQVEVEPACCELLIINTHRGLFQ